MTDRRTDGLHDGTGHNYAQHRMAKAKPSKKKTKVKILTALESDFVTLSSLLANPSISETEYRV